jgi:beta-lactamase class A
VHQLIGKIARDAGAAALAAAYFDYETDSSWSLHGDRWFHAASTIKTAVLVGVFAAADDGLFSLDSRLHVRNRFLSAADGSAFRVPSGRDANGEVHGAIGRTMKVRELALHMITTSSNLATNLLVDLAGVDYIRAVLERIGVRGVDLRRGVEDERAFEADINNRVTANGLLDLFRAIHEERAVSPEASKEMLAILHRQEFKTGIPAGVPASVRAKVAHKTGEISTIAHDSGLVYFPRRKPYAVAVLTEWASGRASRQDTIAKVSEAIYDHLSHKDGHREREAKEKGGGRA